MKITGTQIGIAAVLLWLLLRKKNTPATQPPTDNNVPATPRTNLPTAQPSSRREMPRQTTRDAVAGQWEINCYHQVV